MNHQTPACPNPAVPYLPREQQFIQGVVAQFNDDEQRWRRLEHARTRRRKNASLSAEFLKLLDVLDDPASHKPADCIGTLL